MKDVLKIVGMVIFTVLVAVVALGFVTFLWGCLCYLVWNYIVSNIVEVKHLSFISSMYIGILFSIVVMILRGIFKK